MSFILNTGPGSRQGECADPNVRRQTSDCTERRKRDVGAVREPPLRRDAPAASNCCLKSFATPRTGCYYFFVKREDLLKVSKPTRYLGGEINSAAKDWADVRLKFALAFPDVYEVGMSHLGIQILYHILNRVPEIACERVFAPWPDMEKLLRERGLPLSSLESSRPLKEFDVLGFSLQYELHYGEVLNMLQLAGIPLRAADRGAEYPLIIGGGPCALNPEPLGGLLRRLPSRGRGRSGPRNLPGDHDLASKRRAQRRDADPPLRAGRGLRPFPFPPGVRGGRPGRPDRSPERGLFNSQPAGAPGSRRRGFPVPARPPFHGGDSRPPEH